MEKINILIVDDHEVVVTGIMAVLSKFKELNIVAVANEGKEALAKVEQFKPDIVIMDVKLPDISGIDLTQIIIKNFPDTRVILHSSYIDEKNIISGFEAGAMGYVPKDFKVNDLVDAIKTVYNGQKYLKGIVSQIVLDNLMKNKEPQSSQDELQLLSAREIEVVRYIAMGMVNKEIADKLGISQRTVEAHRSNIQKKLKISSKAELIVFAIKKGIVKI